MSTIANTKRVKVKFEDGVAVGFSMHVPEIYKAAIVNCGFQAGDIIYDSPAGYQEWGVALQKIGGCFHVQSANGGQQGIVTYNVFVSAQGRPALLLLETRRGTQLEFIDQLRRGLFETSAPSLL